MILMLQLLDRVLGEIIDVSLYHCDSPFLFYGLMLDFIEYIYFLSSVVHLVILL